MNLDNMLISDGGEVKALDDSGKVGGYAVYFSTENDPDLVNDFFPPTCDFFLEGRTGFPLLFDHGLDDTLRGRKLAQAKFKIDDVGLWVEAVLKRRDAWEQAVWDLVKKNKLGFSSGSANHLVSRIPRGKSFEISVWPVVEISLTPTQAEPRAQAIALKSYAAHRTDFQDLITNPTSSDLERPVHDLMALERLVHHLMADFSGLQSRYAGNWASTKVAERDSYDEALSLRAEVETMEQEIADDRARRARASESQKKVQEDYQRRLKNFELTGREEPQIFQRVANHYSGRHRF